MFREVTISHFETGMEKFRKKPQEHTENSGFVEWKRIILIRLLESQNDIFRLQKKSDFSVLKA